MLKPSKHLNWKELACKDGSAYPNEFRLDGRVYELARVFEAIRALYGLPITVLSAYRTPEWNKKIGGSRYSQHIQGRALDLLPPKGITVDNFYKDIRARIKNFGITGIGRYKTFVHIDIRPSNRVVYWSGTGIKDSRI